MVTLNISHMTTYRYRKAVQLAPHRLMLRPREGPDTRVTAMALACEPEAKLQWVQDVFGNTVALASFSESAETLRIRSSVDLEHTAEAWPIFPIATSAHAYPFRYSDEDLIDLGALRLPQYPDPGGRFETWVRGFVRGEPTDTLSLLKELNADIMAGLTYVVREDQGTQSPLATLDGGSGSCRDVATVLIEAARTLGLGARSVSGYLFVPGEGDESLVGAGGAGSTHAWAVIYLPGAGWIAFDPTNRSVGLGHLIPVAVARSIVQIAPISGGYIGDPGDFLSLSVAVSVAST